MLLRFEVSNHRSILDPVELSMIAVDGDRAATRGFDRLSERVLTVAGIYGPNASGKSNVLGAIDWLSNAVRASLWMWAEDIPRDPHRFGKGPDTASTFDVDFVVDGVRHGYRLEVDDAAVLYESLHSYPERRRRTLFEREGEEISFRRGLSRTSGIQALLTPTTLALSAAVRLGNPDIEPAGSAVANVGTLGVKQRPDIPFFRWVHDPSNSLFLPIPGHREADFPESHPSRLGAMELLRFADPGIDNIEVTSEGDDLQFVHRVDGEPVAFELEEESAGTQTWFGLLGPALATLQLGQILLFDEIDASLHPRLSARLLELFQDPRTNPRGAQLLFTTHDTSLLNHLNRDEVWLTEKDPGAATRLTALAEYGGDRVRRSTNLERAYLQGRFGAVPEVDQADIRRALGLAQLAR